MGTADNGMKLLSSESSRAFCVVVPLLDFLTSWSLSSAALTA